MKTAALQSQLWGMNMLHLILIASLMSSCATVKKNGYWQTRRYNYGKHIVKEVRGKNNRPTKSGSTSAPPLQVSLESHFMDLYCDSITPDLSDSFIPYLSTIKYPSVTPTDSIIENDSCDLIITTSGRVIRCTIMDVTLEGYRYVNCPDGTVPQLIERDKIREVRRTDGSILHINTKPPAKGKNISWWKRAMAWTFGISLALSFAVGITADPASNGSSVVPIFLALMITTLIWVIALPILLILYLIGLLA